METHFSFEFSKADVDEDQNLVFGWASVSKSTDGTLLTDSHNHQIDIDEIEAGAYVFNLCFRKAGVDHEGEAVGDLIESMVFTPKKLELMGLKKGAVPEGWWAGFHINDDDAFAKVKSGEYEMFSIQGRAVLEEVK